MSYVPVVAPKPKPVIGAVGAAVAVVAPPNENVVPGVVVPAPPNGPGEAPKLKFTSK